MIEKELVNYRRVKAVETLDDARVLIEHGRLESAVNRIYYAVFYIVSALLLTRDLSSSKHSGVKSMFIQNFVKTKSVSLEDGSFYSSIFEFRQKADYADYVNFDLETVRQWIKQAEDFIAHIDELISIFIGGETDAGE